MLVRPGSQMFGHKHAWNNVIHFQDKPTKRYCIISEHSGFFKANDQMCCAAVMPVSKRGLRIGLQEILVAQTQNYSTSQCQDYASETVSALILLQTISKTTWQNNGRIWFQHQCIRCSFQQRKQFYAAVQYMRIWKSSRMTGKMAEDLNTAAQAGPVKSSKP